MFAALLQTRTYFFLRFRLVNKTISKAINHLFYLKLKAAIIIQTKRNIFDVYHRMKLEIFAMFIKEEKNNYVKDNVMTECCLEGRFDLVIYLTENIFDAGYVNNHAMDNACMKGHLQIVKYLHKKGYPLTTGCFMAAEYGHFPVVYYLHENKCPYHPNSLSQASCYGHYDMVKWLLENGYQAEGTAVNHAAGKGDKRIIELLHKFIFVNIGLKFN